MIKTIVTGASGLLGRAIISDLSNDRQIEEIGLCYSRQGQNLKKCDLKDESSIKSIIESEKPQVVIHCAAERRPDVAEKDEKGAEQLNIGVPATLGRLTKNANASLIYISTDYVFDGRNPPYETNDSPNPLNFYGKTKLAGEKAALDNNDKTIVVRVPVLYGKVEEDKESAVNVLVKAVKDSQSGKPTKMEHYAKRYPTCVESVASALKGIIKKLYIQGSQVPNVIHFTAKEAYSKYEMSCIFADLLGLSKDNLVADTEEPKGESAVSRPKDCHLSRKVFDGLDIEFNETKFVDWFRDYFNN